MLEKKMQTPAHRVIVLTGFLAGLILGNLWGSTATRRTANKEIGPLQQEIESFKRTIALNGLEIAE